MDTTERKRLYLDDLYVGQRFSSRSYPMDADRMKAFAAEFDPQPFHTDEEAARNSVFQGLAASGWYTAAVSMRLMVESVPLGNGLIGLGAEADWPRPTRVGDTLRLECEVIEIRPSRSKPNQAVVRVRNTTLNQHDEEVQVLVAKLLVKRAPDAH